MSGPLRLFLIGPEIVLLAGSMLAVLTLFAIATRRATAFFEVFSVSATRLEHGAAAPCVWGLALLAMVGLLFVVFAKHGLLALLALTAGLVLFALGLAAGGVYIGRTLGVQANAENIPNGSALLIGMLVLFLAVLVPLAGWAIALWAIASGLGAAIEAMVAGSRSIPP